MISFAVNKQPRQNEMIEVKTDIFLGNCKEVLKQVPDNNIDLIFTSPPYADQRKSTYGGVYVAAFSNFLPMFKN